VQIQPCTVGEWRNPFSYTTQMCWSVLECVGVCWSVLECVGVCCSAVVECPMSGHAVGGQQAHQVILHKDGM